MGKSSRITLAFLASFLLIITRSAYSNGPKAEAEKLFNNESIPLILLNISKEQWGYLLNNFNSNPNNNQYIEVDRMIFQPMQNGKAMGAPETLSNIQVKLKGNTSRICPESVGNNTCGPHATSFGQFHQANFKLKFKNTGTNNKQYLHGYEQLSLKTFKGQMSKSREIYSFNTLESILDKTKMGQYSLAPRISHAHLYIAIEGDNAPGNHYNPLDTSQVCDQSYHCYDFGYYEMLEPVNSNGYLDTRFGNNNGYMWKGNSKGGCFEGLNIEENGKCDLQVFKKTIQAASSTNCATDIACDTSMPFGILHEPWDGKNAYKPAYDYGSKTKHFDKALNTLAAFMYNLNFLSAAADARQISPLENWIVNGVTPDDWTNPFDPDKKLEYKFDYKSFLATMAFDVAIGSWDGYWYNNNNFALYFDKDNKTVHFIPNDYDTVLGSIPSNQTNCGEIMGTTPLKTFGLDFDKKPNKPLITRLLEVPTFLAVYEQAFRRIKSSMDQTTSQNYPEFVQQYQLICHNFQQNSGLDCSSSEIQNYLCSNPRGLDDDSEMKCDSSHYLMMPNDTNGINSVGVRAKRSKIVADLPVFYGQQFYRLFSSTRYGTEKPTANFFLTTQFNIENGYVCH
jgi:hypothetical protein